MEDIKKLLAICTGYAVDKGLCGPEDRFYVQNRLLALFNLDSPYEGEVEIPENIAGTLALITDYAVGLCLLKANTAVFREMFDNRVASCMLMPPSEVAYKFLALQESAGTQKATDWFYKLCLDSNYIRTLEIARNIRYSAPSEYGRVEVTINLTKPEKDPKEIALALAAPTVSYPACQLCVQNVGYAGRVNHPPRQLLRTVPITLNGEKWHFQYSPYVYFNEHCIALSEAHVPMEINESTYRRLVDFQLQFPHYFIGSNAGLPIAGGSILTHLHFQGGRYTMPMMRASLRRQYPSPLKDVSISSLHWPMPAVRLKSQNGESLVKAATAITAAWENYNNEELGIFSQTDGQPHNTITPIMHMEDGVLILDLVLRNNITNEYFPLGVFHPHPCRHHIKRENIGLIEVMGVFILPGRLKSELEETAKYLCGQSYMPDKAASHTQWADSFKDKYNLQSYEQAYSAVKDELAVLCMQLLGDAAVFKDDPTGNAAFDCFISGINF